MNEESQHPSIEPELEARIVALVLGEASDFECEELNRLIAQRSELAAFKLRMQTAHGVLQDVGTGEFEAPGDDWKLSAGKRNAVLAVIRGEATVPAMSQGVDRPAKQRVAAKRSVRWRLTRAVAGVCVTGFVGVIAWRSFFPDELGQDHLMKQLGLATKEIPAVASVDRRLVRESLSGGTDLFFDIPTAVADREQQEAGSKWFGQKHSANSNVALSAIRNTLGYQASDTFLDDDVQYAPAGPDFKLQAKNVYRYRRESEKEGRGASTVNDTPSAGPLATDGLALLDSSTMAWMYKERSDEDGHHNGNGALGLPLDVSDLDSVELVDTLKAAEVSDSIAAVPSLVEAPDGGTMMLGELTLRSGIASFEADDPARLSPRILIDEKEESLTGVTQNVAGDDLMLSIVDSTSPDGESNKSFRFITPDFGSENLESKLGSVSQQQGGQQQGGQQQGGGQQQSGEEQSLRRFEESSPEFAKDQMELPAVAGVDADRFGRQQQSGGQQPGDQAKWRFETREPGGGEANRDLANLFGRKHPSGWDSDRGVEATDVEQLGRDSMPTDGHYFGDLYEHFEGFAGRTTGGASGTGSGGNATGGSGFGFGQGVAKEGRGGTGNGNASGTSGFGGGSSGGFGGGGSGGFNGGGLAALAGLAELTNEATATGSGIAPTDSADSGPIVSNMVSRLGSVPGEADSGQTKVVDDLGVTVFTDAATPTMAAAIPSYRVPAGFESGEGLEKLAENSEEFSSGVVPRGGSQVNGRFDSYSVQVPVNGTITRSAIQALPGQPEVPYTVEQPAIGFTGSFERNEKDDSILAVPEDTADPRLIGRGRSRISGSSVLQDVTIDVGGAVDSRQVDEQRKSRQPAADRGGKRDEGVVDSWHILPSPELPSAMPQGDHADPKSVSSPKALAGLGSLPNVRFGTVPPPVASNGYFTWRSPADFGVGAAEQSSILSTPTNRKSLIDLSKKAESQPKSTVTKAAPVASLNEKSASNEAFSTFSLHVSDVSFKLAMAALGKGEWPEAAKVRIEEFVNAFDYGDPMPANGEKVACTIEQSIHPFVQQRNLLRVSMRTAAAGRASQTPLRLTFVLDNSGSMERIDRQQTVRRAFAMLAQQLTPIDQVTLISFARQPRLLADKVGGADAGKLVGLIDELPSEGGTNIEAALQLAFEKATEQQNSSAQNRIILLTDGAVNLGNANPESLSQMVTAMRNSGIAFDAAGISADGLNDEVLEALTRKGDGRYYLLDSLESADDGFAKQIAGALRPSAKNVKVQVEFNPKRVGHYKLLGFEKHILKKEDFRNDKVDAAEMAASEAGVAMYQFEALPDGEGDVGSVSVRFRDLSTGQMVENRWPIPYEADAPRPDQASASLRIATSAAMLAARLKGEPLGASVDLQELSELVSGLPEQVRSEKRVQQLQQMIEQARQLDEK